MGNTQIYYSATPNPRFQTFLWSLKITENGVDPGQLFSSETAYLDLHYFLKRLNLDSAGQRFILEEKKVEFQKGNGNLIFHNKNSANKIILIRRKFSNVIGFISANAIESEAYQNFCQLA